MVFQSAGLTDPYRAENETVTGRFMNITRKSIIADVIRNHRKTTKVLDQYHLMCAGCRGAVEESVEKVATNYGIDPDTFLTQLKDAAKE